MIREEAINMLHGMRADNLNLDDLYIKDKYEALDMAIKALEQEPILDKIRAEIAGLQTYHREILTNSTVFREMLILDEVMQIIDKYKAETEA